MLDIIKKIPELWHGIRLRFWVKEIGSIFTHGAWAAMTLAPILLHPAWWTGFIAGFLLDAPREFVDQLPIRRWWDTIYDLIVFAIAGMLIAGFLTGWVL